jgi:hypothetical protein
MGVDRGASSWASEIVGSVRDDPAGRVAVMRRCYGAPSGAPSRRLPYRRAALSFMAWQLRRGVLRSPAGERPGSPWWRAVNERILRDGCEAVARSAGLAGPVSSPTVERWSAFVRRPSAGAWYGAHNASVVAAYLDHRDLAGPESAAERFFLNVILCRVLYAHALVAAPRLALAWMSPLGSLLGDPRLGMTGIFVHLSRVLPDEYPLRGPVRAYVDAELGFGQLVDYGLIVPRLDELYAWSAEALDAPGLLDCVRDGALTYAWPGGDRDVWRAPDTAALRVVRRAVPVAARARADG